MGGEGQERNKNYLVLPWSALSLPWRYWDPEPSPGSESKERASREITCKKENNWVDTGSIYLEQTLLSTENIWSTRLYFLPPLGKSCLKAAIRRTLSILSWHRLPLTYKDDCFSWHRSMELGIKWVMLLYFLWGCDVPQYRANHKWNLLSNTLHLILER